MANAFKLTDDDDHFLQIPHDGTLIFAGASGTESWIERDHDAVVRIGVKAVGVALANGGVLGVAIDIGEASAHGEDGPALPETPLRASQSVQVLVKAGERLAFKAYPKAEGVHVMRTVVWAADMPAETAATHHRQTDAAKANGGRPDAEHRPGA
jgi:hypothetical protein